MSKWTDSPKLLGVTLNTEHWPHPQTACPNEWCDSVNGFKVVIDASKEDNWKRYGDTDKGH
jgi:hypothetical protein